MKTDLALTSFWPAAVYANEHPQVGDKGIWYVGKDGKTNITVTAVTPSATPTSIGYVSFATDTPVHEQTQFDDFRYFWVQYTKEPNGQVVNLLATK